MASEIKLQTVPALSGITAKAIVSNSDGKAWDNVSLDFVDYADANIARYAVAMTEDDDVAGLYVGDMPTGITVSGVYDVLLFKLAGVTLTSADEQIGEGEIDWNGAGEIVSPTGGALISLATVKALLGITSSDLDAVLTALINFASEQIKTYCNRDFVVTDYAEYYDPAQTVSRLVLRQRPVTELTAVTFYPHETIAEEFQPTKFVVDSKAGIIQFKLTEWRYFPGGNQTVKVDYTAGYASIPYDLQMACYNLVCKIFHSRKRDPNLTSEKLGDWQATYKAYANADTLISGEVKTTLDSYRSLNL